MGQLSWVDACERVQSDDGLVVRDVGAWSEDKLFVWHKYIQTTTSAMVGKPAWRHGLAYVDLFAGPGVCRIRDTYRRLPGSLLIAAMAAKPFAQITLVEFDAACAAAYKVFGTKVVKGPSGPLYRLIYASKHDRGLDFWNKVDFKDRHGQAGLFGP